MMTRLDEIEFFKQFPHFRAGEMRCKCDQCIMPIDDPEFFDFMLQLENLRESCSFPFTINSGYRCPDYNDQIYVKRGAKEGEHRTGPHTIGAADVSCAFERAYKLQRQAFIMELGVGPKQKGPIKDRFVHVDNQGMRSWTY